jgi:energy-coupling factor transporter ATP-binding protein EcfA2
MKNEIIQKTKKSYHFFDSLGNFKYHNIIKNLLFVNTILFIIWYINSNLIFDITQINNFDYYINIVNIYINDLKYFLHNMRINTLLNKQISIYYYTVVAPFIFTLIYISYSLLMYRKSTYQKRLAKVGLEAYQYNNFYSFFTKSIIIEPKRNEEMDINYIKNNIEELAQVWKLDISKDIKIEPFKHDKVKISVMKDLPDVVSFDVTKLKKDYFYLGTHFNNKNKLSEFYLPFNSFLHTAILGTSGGGKSTFLNILISNIFYNYKKLDKFYFIDFKGGIASKPYLNIARKYDIEDDIIITCDNDFKKLHSILTDITQINHNRMEYLKTNDHEKWTDEYIFLVFDEFAQILMYDTVEKEDKELLKQIISMINSLFSTGRSQNIRIIYSTQSYVKEASGVNNTIKTNTSTKFLFNTTQSTSISSIVSTEDLEEIGVSPKKLLTGEALILDNEYVNSQKFKSSYIDTKIDDTINEVIQQSIQDNKPLKYKIREKLINFALEVLVYLFIFFIFFILYLILPKTEYSTKSTYKNIEVYHEKK